VKKLEQIKKIVGTHSFSEAENKIKTTNINILLNRVRLDQKKDLKKKLILFFLLATILSSLIVLVI
tara:strand:- start:1023 stop:1220 length:198 start_codon:yes stop_codon:yes gene_type:complete